MSELVINVAKISYHEGKAGSNPLAYNTCNTFLIFGPSDIKQASPTTESKKQVKIIITVILIMGLCVLRARFELFPTLSQG
jgi:hypothetical protein